jgi:predicted TIM-barrel fold metal-dependent hydrolase
MQSKKDSNGLSRRAVVKGAVVAGIGLSCAQSGGRRGLPDPAGEDEDDSSTGQAPRTERKDAAAPVDTAKPTDPADSGAKDASVAGEDGSAQDAAPNATEDAAVGVDSGAPDAGVSGDARPEFRTDNIPDNARVDTHIHFYWPDGSKTPGAYYPGAQRAGITVAMIVEAPGVSNSRMLDIANNTNFVVGVIGTLPVGQANFQRDLEQFGKNKFFRGIRTSPGVIRSGASGSTTVLRDLRLMGQRGLAVDMLTQDPADFARLGACAKAVPGSAFVIEHVGGRTAGSSGWASALRSVADIPNVYMKVSNISSASNAMLDTIWKTFGEDRVFMGTNWPVLSQSATPNAVRGYVGNLSREAQKKFWAVNARRAYGWVSR